MATNEQFQGDGTSFLSRFASTTIGLGAVGAASYKLWQHTNNNRPIKSVKDLVNSVDRTESGLGRVFKNVGANVKAQADITSAERTRLAGELATTLSRGDYIRQMSATVEESQVLLNSVLATINDPSTGLESVLSPSVRDEIINLMHRMQAAQDPTVLHGDMEKVLSGFMSALAGGTDKNRDVWARHLNESKGIAQTLIAPKEIVAPTRGVKKFINLDEAGSALSLSDRARKDARAALNLLHASGFNGEHAGYELVGDGETLVARLYRNGKNGSRDYLPNFPLFLGEKQPGTPIAKRPVNYTPYPDMGTTQRFARGGLDEAKVRDIMNAAPGVGLHSVPARLSSSHRALLDETRQLMQADPTRSREHVAAMVERARRGTKTRSLVRLNADQWHDYLTATMGMDVRKLPTLSDAYISTEEMIQREILRDLPVSGGDPRGVWRLNKRQMFERIQSLGIFNSRAYRGGTAAQREHLSRAYSFDQNYLKLISSDQAFVTQVVPQLNANPWSSASASPSRLMHRTSIGSRTHYSADIGMMDNSALANIGFSTRGSFFGPSGEPLGGELRVNSMFPKTARLEQMVGREERFVTPAVATNRGFQLGAGPALGWNESMTGTTNKLYMMVAAPDNEADAAASFYHAWDGRGQMFHAGEEVIEKVEGFKVVDPKQAKLGQGKLLDAISANGGSIVLENGNNGYRLGEQELGTFIGYDTRGKQVHVGANPNNVLARISLERKSVRDLNRDTMDVIVGEVTRHERSPGFKGFGTWAKAMFAPVSGRVAKDDIERIGGSGIVSSLSNHLGLEENVVMRHLAYGVADQVKKAPGFWDQQITSAFKILGGDPGALAARATQINAPAKTVDDLMAGLTQAFLELAHGHGMNAREVGHALAGVASKSSTHAKAVRARIAESAYAGNADFQQALASRLFFGAGALSVGEGVSDFHSARGSMDRRQAGVIAARLKTMGLQEGQIVSIMSDIMGRLDNVSDNGIAAKGLMGIAEAARGLGSPLKAGDKTRVLSLSELTTAMGDHDLDTFLSGQTGPLKFTFAGGDTVGDRAITAAAAKVLGTEPIPLPTGELLEALRGTTIRKSDGPARIVAGEFSADLTHLLSYLKQYMGTAGAVDERGIENQMLEWRTSLTHLAAKTQVESMSSKLKGSMMLPNFTVDLSELDGKGGALRGQRFGLSPKQREFAEAAERLGGKGTVFFDDQAMLGLLRQYSEVDATDAAHKAERFFAGAFGLETSDKTLKSVSAMAVRQPVLGLGHVAPVQIFRHLGTEGGEESLERFKAVMGGKYDDLVSWRDVAALSGNRHTGRKREFFQDFIANLNKFAGTEGGSSYTVTKMRRKDISIGGRLIDSAKYTDYGIQAIMGADSDGDHLNYIMSRAHHSELLSKAATSADFHSLENVYKEAWAGYTVTAKESLQELKNKYHLSGNTAMAQQIDQVMQDVMKESASKAATGPLDVQLNRIRLGAMDMALSATDRETAYGAARISGMLAVLQEHTLLKSKKAPIYLPFADYLGQAVKNAMSDDGSAQGLKDLLSQIIFGAWKGDVVVGDTTINLNQDLDILDAVIRHTKKLGIDIDVSGGALGTALNDSNREIARRAFNSIKGGEGVTGAYVRGFAGDTIEAFEAVASNTAARVQKAIGNFDTRTGTMIGLGIMAAGVGMSLFAPSYSSQPLTSVYDRPRPEVAGSIRQHHALAPSSQSVSTPDNAYAMMPRSVNERATYLGRQNGFQVRGTVNNRADVDNVMSVLKLGPMGSGHVTVGWNDNRRPITQNYIDRMLGAY